MSLDLAQFHESFFEESFEALDAMEAALLKLDVGVADHEGINTIFRGAHSMKGGAAMLGFADVASFTHTLETLLDELRAGRMQVSAPILDSLLKSVDVLREMLRAVKGKQPVDAQRVADLQFDLEAIVARKDGGVTGAQAAPTSAPEVAPTAAPDGAPVPAATVARLPATSARAGASSAATPAAASTATSPDASAPASQLPAPAKASQSSGASDSTSIRVGIDKIDELINIVGELVITQAMLSELGRALEGPSADFLKSGLGQLERNMRQLQEGVMRVRMLPISVAFSRFPRMVHDLALRLGKKIELKLAGEQTELDKTVLEKIGDPLVHLVRNSLDHGIETPDVRTAAGKPPFGTISLNAYHSGGNIAVEVIDDGAGLDKARILAKAKSRGLVGANDVLTEEQIHELIFLPGFSTAEKTTDVSGRGVGMDVVRQRVKELGGAVDIRSERGRGSRFLITLPLTLSIVDGQSVRLGSECYIVPLTSIIESLQLKVQDVSRLSGAAEIFKFRGDYLPLIRLHALFGIEARAQSLQDGLIVVAEGDGKRVGLFVDELLGQQQVVIKSMESNYGHIEGIAGATILGDGSVALILDVPGLIRATSMRAAA